MQFSTIALISALAASVSANGNHSISAVWVTDVVTSFTTVCPAATTLSFNGVTYTATESETITITNCPCTISKPVYTTSSVICNTCTAPSPSAPTGSAPAYGNSTTPAPTTAASSSNGGSIGTTSLPVVSSATTASPSASTTPLIVSNGGHRAVVFSGAGLAGLIAVAAYVL
ncbi:hypothetical protein SBOR_9046 [Sclerotinia borealis F-4128]|uniref:Mmc protein n=1 Tax=Sclerotinia borealis (strain F-4128) TaxID=1432307 RepID=W9C6P0_SCLBF|nr:hypothetical protein SBOR_9046 [Sclerotinia borealis F-4128]